MAHHDAIDHRAAVRARLPSIPMLSRKVEIDAVRRHGRQVASSLFVVVYAFRGEGQSRVVFTITRRLGNAVVRNHLRRQLREILRPLLVRLRAPIDLMVIPRTQAIVAPFQEKAADIERLLACRRLLADPLPVA